jgi:hypothetical protein
MLIYEDNKLLFKNVFMTPGFHNIFVEMFITMRDNMIKDINCDFYEIIINLDE